MTNNTILEDIGLIEAGNAVEQDDSGAQLAESLACSAFKIGGILAFRDSQEEDEEHFRRIRESIMTVRDMKHYVSQNRLAKLFGLSLLEMDYTLIEHGLKSEELATEKAIDGDYAVLSGIREHPNHWNPIKISKLTGRKFHDEIGFYCQEVTYRLDVADTDYDSTYSLIIASHAYDQVPESLRTEVAKRIDRKLIGDRRRACKKCGRLTFFTIKDFCWRCMQDDPFHQQKLDCEALVRQEADQLAASGWGRLHENRNLEPRDTDLDLWNSAMDTVIDRLFAGIVDPSKFDERQADYYAYDVIDGQNIMKFEYSRREDHGRTRCSAFLHLAYNTIVDLLLKLRNKEEETVP